jgi:hypothetical protein
LTFWRDSATNESPKRETKNEEFNPQTAWQIYWNARRGRKKTGAFIAALIMERCKPDIRRSDADRFKRQRRRASRRSSSGSQRRFITSAEAACNYGFPRQEKRLENCKRDSRALPRRSGSRPALAAILAELAPT